MTTEDDNSELAEVATPVEEKSNFLVKERYEVKFDLPLPNLNSNGAIAYSVNDRINPSRELFALICDNNIPPRLSILPYLKSIDHPNILNLVEYGIVDYDPQKSRNLALIYRKPSGARVSSFKPMDESTKVSPDLFKSQILSMISATEALKGYNITHRSIRLDNIFYKDETRSEIVLGDCAATFPSLFQPTSYETIENMLCLPEGRGNGDTSQDIYSIGVCMLGVLLQKEISPNMSSPELMRAKLKKGSYSALIGEEKISSGFSSILKAILNDNKENRWNYLQVYNFLEGKPNGNPMPETPDRSVRSLTFNGEKFYSARSAAIAMLDSPNEAFNLIKTGKLSEWVKNGLENEKAFFKIEKVLNQETDSENVNFIVSQACCILDPSLPLKSGEVVFFPDGLPKAIFYYLKNNKSIADFLGVLNSDMIRYWYQEQSNLRSPSNVSEFKLFINRNDLGYGIERIMYDFDDDLPCTSPLLGNEFVNSPPKLLRALNDNFKNIRNNEQPYDRNIIAFLRCKMGNKIDGILTDINSRQENLKASAILRLYTNIQNKNGPALLPHLAQWLARTSMPIIKIYHNIKYQKFLERRITKVSKSGKLVEMYELLENDEAKQKDRTEYSEALKEINYLVTERNKITKGGVKIDEEARALSIRFASLIAILTMTLSFVLNLVYWIMK